MTKTLGDTKSEIETPKGFEDIDAKVLRTQAVEDWAVDVKPSDSLKKVVKALEDAGVFWEDYADRYGYSVVNTLDAPDSVDHIAEPAAPAATQFDPTAANTGTLAAEHDVTQRTPEPTRAEKPVSEPTRGLPQYASEPTIAYAQAPVVEQNVQYLVKMERPNERYQHGKYTWTKRHPYALVDGKDLEAVLRHEPGFRQAYPSEAAEFYS
jgi:hypothetical protein